MYTVVIRSEIFMLYRFQGHPNREHDALDTIRCLNRPKHPFTKRKSRKTVPIHVLLSQAIYLLFALLGCDSDRSFDALHVSRTSEQRTRRAWYDTLLESTKTSVHEEKIVRNRSDASCSESTALPVRFTGFKYIRTETSTRLMRYAANVSKNQNAPI